MANNNIDIIMDLDPLEATPADIDAVIAYHRRNKIAADSGIKPKKEQGPKVSLDSVVSALLKKPQEAVPTLKRRI